jgi:hypothetical protein
VNEVLICCQNFCLSITTIRNPLCFMHRKIKCVCCRIC